MRDALNRQLKVAGDDPQAQFKETVTMAGMDGKELTQDEKYSVRVARELQRCPTRGL